MLVGAAPVFGAAAARFAAAGEPAPGFGPPAALPVEAENREGPGRR